MASNKLKISGTVSVKEVKKVARLQCNMDVDLHRQFKIATTVDGVEMTDVLTEAVKDYLRRREEKK